LLNQKLWAKVAVVALLTLNGGLLHRVGFPLLQKAPFVLLPGSDRARLALLGAFSMSGWLFAAFLGVARAWNHVMPCLHVMGVFTAFALLACAVALVVASTAGTIRGEEPTVS
jgi:disulfide bond formation protein DsbB